MRTDKMVDGTLPMNITEVAVNSSFPFALKTQNMTIPAGNGTVAPINATAASVIASAAASPTASVAMAEKRRWLGQW
jgi:hypothetical protein